jgi:hypothetical protein
MIVVREGAILEKEFIHLVMIKLHPSIPMDLHPTQLDLSICTCFDGTQQLTSMQTSNQYPHDPKPPYQI